MRVHGVTLEGKENDTHSASQNSLFKAVSLQTLTFSLPGRYLNFSTRFVKNTYNFYLVIEVPDDVYVFYVYRPLPPTPPSAFRAHTCV